MMKYTENEILDALRVIKKVCSGQKDCETCPLRKYDEDGALGCSIGENAPLGWKIKEKRENWRAFE